MLCLSGFELYSRWVPLFPPVGPPVNGYKSNAKSPDFAHIET